MIILNYKLLYPYRIMISYLRQTTPLKYFIDNHTKLMT